MLADRTGRAETGVPPGMNIHRLIPDAHRVVSALTMLIALVVATAGVMKLLDLSEFDFKLRSWGILNNDALRAVVVVFVPAFELAIGFFLLLAPSLRRPLAVILILMLTGVSSAYAIEAYARGAPDCACFGLLNQYLQLRTDVEAILVRNSVMIVVVASWLLLNRACTPPRTTASHAATFVARRAFTLLEMLICLVIIAVLVVLIVPSLRNIRRNGREAGTLSNLKHHAAVFSTYTHEHRDACPYFTRPLPGPASPIPLPNGRVLDVHYFSAYFTWRYILSPGYYGNNAGHPSFTSPLKKDAPHGSWDYLYPCVFLADPAYWRTETRTLPPTQFRAIRLSDIAYPGAKAFVVDEAGWSTVRKNLSRAAPVGCADGHAEIVIEGRMAEQYWDGDGNPGGPSFPYSRHYDSHNALLHTVGGVAEPDFITAKTAP